MFCQIAPYFAKVECFCFEEQKILANEEVDLPVFFFIDRDVLECVSFCYACLPLLYRPYRFVLTMKFLLFLIGTQRWTMSRTSFSTTPSSSTPLLLPSSPPLTCPISLFGRSLSISRSLASPPLLLLHRARRNQKGHSVPDAPQAVVDEASGWADIEMADTGKEKGWVQVGAK
jgi:hypothetical protein